MTLPSGPTSPRSHAAGQDVHAMVAVICAVDEVVRSAMDHVGCWRSHPPGLCGR